MSASAFRLYIYCAVALIHLTFIIISFRARKKVRPALPFAYFVFWVTVSVSGNIIGQLLPDLAAPDPLIWLYLSFGGAVMVGPAFILLILNQLRSKLGTNPIFGILLHLPSFILLFLVYSNPTHQMIWRPSAELFQPGFYGRFHPVAVSITALCALIALVLLLYQLVKKPGVTRSQDILLIFGALFPIAGQVFSTVSSTPPSTSLDLVIASWTLMLLVYGYALFRLPMRGLLPIAQNELLHHIRDGFLITNSYQEIVYINPAAQKTFQTTSRQAVGKPLSSLISSSTTKIIVNTQTKHTSFELRVGQGFYHVNISNIRSKRQQLLGQIITMYDVTAQTEFANQFREQANKDELTNVYNRRCLLEEARIEFERARRYHLPFSIIILDLDNLKGINDKYGHITGDDAIKTLSAACQSALRGSDSIGRLGGDEFMILLPHTAAPRAVSIVQRLTTLLEKTKINTDQGPLRLSASFGITSLDKAADINLDEMIKRADQALYLAKSDPKSDYAEVQSFDPRAFQ